MNARIQEHIVDVTNGRIGMDLIWSLKGESRTNHESICQQVHTGIGKHLDKLLFTLYEGHMTILSYHRYIIYLTILITPAMLAIATTAHQSAVGTNIRLQVAAPAWSFYPQMLLL